MSRQYRGLDVCEGVCVYMCFSLEAGVWTGGKVMGV
jgi:hypothetical protein